MDTMDIKDFPFLNSEEFTGACHQLDRQYCQATLGPLRRRWKLRVRTALDLTGLSGTGSTTYIQIVRPLEVPAQDDDLSLALDDFSFTQEDGAISSSDADQDMIAMEESDEHVLNQHFYPDIGYVTYEIHLHPTYRVPCLWFSLQGLPNDEPAFNIETVFRRLVPDAYKGGLRQSIGGIGGISADHHPMTGIPTFFIHPCLIGDAMSNFPCSRENYLTVWLGLVGGCVDLWVPKEMIAS